MSLATSPCHMHESSPIQLGKYLFMWWKICCRVWFWDTRFPNPAVVMLKLSPNVKKLTKLLPIFSLFFCLAFHYELLYLFWVNYTECIKLKLIKDWCTTGKWNIKNSNRSISRFPIMQLQHLSNDESYFLFPPQNEPTTQSPYKIRLWWSKQPWIHKAGIWAEETVYLDFDWSWQRCCHRGGYNSLVSLALALAPVSSWSFQYL